MTSPRNHGISEETIWTSTVWLFFWVIYIFCLFLDVFCWSRSVYFSVFWPKQSQTCSQSPYSKNYERAAELRSQPSKAVCCLKRQPSGIGTAWALGTLQEQWCWIEMDEQNNNFKNHRLSQKLLQYSIYDITFQWHGPNKTISGTTAYQLFPVVDFHSLPFFWGFNSAFLDGCRLSDGPGLRASVPETCLAYKIL